MMKERAGNVLCPCNVYSHTETPISYLYCCSASVKGHTNGRTAINQQLEYPPRHQSFTERSQASKRLYQIEETDAGEASSSQLLPFSTTFSNIMVAEIMQEDRNVGKEVSRICSLCIQLRLKTKPELKPLI